MKNFVRMTLACLAAIVLFIVGSFMLLTTLVGIVGAIGGSGSDKIAKHSVLRVSMDATLEERTAEENPFASLLGQNSESATGLNDLIVAIRTAGEDKNIDGIFLDGGTMNGDYAQLQSLRRELRNFKKSGKFIVAYADNYTQSGYYVASVADTVVINPQGMLDWHGIASQPIFYTGLLEKVGVKMQVFKVGTFKSAVEPFILTGMSEANREQVTSYITDIWQTVVYDVAKSRKVKESRLNELADHYISLADAHDYKKVGLVDKVSYIDDVRAMLRNLTDQESVSFVSAGKVLTTLKPSKSNNEIAVYFASGDIVDAPSAGYLGANNQEIVGSTVVSDLDGLANDDNVKAVVLRINSGGGSAYASEQMWRAIQLLGKKKPVVVSMSGMAASGGYYMSCGAHYIYAEPTTLTGSIGIFGMIPDASVMLREKLGLSFDVVKTNESSDFGAAGRPFNPAEGDAMQEYVNRGYATFLKRVADGRSAVLKKQKKLPLSVNDVDKIAQGRVWTGRQAMELRLVDALGSLDEAIAKAAKLAKCDDWYTADYPALGSFMDNLSQMNNSDDYFEQRVKTLLGEYYNPLSFVLNADRNSMLQTRIYYIPNLK